MKFEVKIADGKVRVKLPREPEGTEYLRLDMSDRSVAFLKVARARGRSLIFSFDLELVSKSLWVHLRTKLFQDALKRAQKTSETPPKVQINEAHTIAFKIGHPLRVIFDVLITQDKASQGATVRFNSAPLLIQKVSATTLEEARAEMAKRGRKR